MTEVLARVWYARALFCIRRDEVRQRNAEANVEPPFALIPTAA